MEHIIVSGCNDVVVFPHYLGRLPPALCSMERFASRYQGGRRTFMPTTQRVESISGNSKGGMYQTLWKAQGQGTLSRPRCNTRMLCGPQRLRTPRAGRYRPGTTRPTRQCHAQIPLSHHSLDSKSRFGTIVPPRYFESQTEKYATNGSNRRVGRGVNGWMDDVLLNPEANKS